MLKTVQYHVWPRALRFGEKLALISDFASGRGLQHHQGTDIDYESHYRVKLDRYTSITCDTIEEFIATLDRCEAFERFYFNTAYVNVNTKRYLEVHIENLGYYVEVRLGSRDPDLVELGHIFIKDNLQLANPEMPLDDVPQPPKYHTPRNPTVFVGRHFDKAADDYFQTLSYFLRLVGCDVKQGKGYTSKPIPDKVKARIDAQDIFIALVTGKRGHAWLIAEPAYALAKEKHVILIVEEESEYDPTILGADLEQIRFPAGHIEKSFIPLLRELHAVVWWHL
jgi:hypothetical protein